MDSSSGVDMNRQQAVEFVNAINAIQPYVPPILFGPIINSEFGKLAVSLINGAVTCEVKSTTPDQPPTPKGNGAEHQPTA